MTIEVFAEPEEHAFDLFVTHAAPDAEFVRGYLLPALNLPSARVLLMDALPVGGVVVSEIDRGVARSRFTVAVLSPVYLADRWAAFGEQLASHLSAQDVHVIPLRLLDCELPLRLNARVSLDFRDPAHWEAEGARLRDLLHTAEPATEQIACRILACVRSRSRTRTGSSRETPRSTISSDGSTAASGRSI